MPDFLQNTATGDLEQVVNLGVSLGKSAAHSLFPNNFEYYLCSFELYDSTNKMIGLLSFTVMPNNMLVNKTQIANITKTNKSVFTIFNDSFVPTDISIQGTFGRKFRLILNDKEIGGVGKDLAFGKMLPSVSKPTPVLVKSGYGMTKMLEKMIQASWTLDSNGLPCFLVFRNYSMNQALIVEVVQHSFSQSMDSNMLWNYALEMKGVAPASILWQDKGNTNTNKVIGRVLASAGSKSLNNIISSVKKSLLRF